jgi:hypothetical protein
MVKGGSKVPEGDPPHGWQRVPPYVDSRDDFPDIPAFTPSASTPEAFDNENGLEVSLYPDGELQISWINRFSQLLTLRSLVNWLSDDVQTVKAYATNGFKEKYFKTEELAEETMQRLNNLASTIGFQGTYERKGTRIWIIFTKIK